MQGASPIVPFVVGAGPGVGILQSLRRSLKHDENSILHPHSASRFGTNAAKQSNESTPFGLNVSPL